MRAARIASHAHGGQLLVSDIVRERLDDQDLPVVDLKAFEFGDVTAPFQLFEPSLGLDGGCGSIDPMGKNLTVSVDPTTDRLTPR